MKCKPYSEITVEIRTQLKTVKITSNIFAVWPTKPFIEKSRGIDIFTYEKYMRFWLVL